MVAWFEVDGIDSVGKSTQTKLLVEEFAKIAPHLKTVTVQEFSNTVIGDLIRNIIETKRFLASADFPSTIADTHLLLADLFAKFEQYRNGHTDIVIADRSALSLAGYQSKRIARDYAGSDAAEIAQSLMQMADREVARIGVKPNLYLLTIDPDELQRRVVKRGESKLDDKDLQFLLGIQDYMIQEAHKWKYPVLNVSALTIDEVRSKLFEHFRSLIPAEGLLPPVPNKTES